MWKLPCVFDGRVMNRRAFNKRLISAAMTYSLMDSLLASNAFSASVKPIVKHWSIGLNQFCEDLQKESITPKEWQEQVEILYRMVDLNELLRFIDFKNLIKGFEYPDLGVNTNPVNFPKLAGLPENTIFVKKIFGMKKDRSIIPHGHSNMVSAHLVINGEMHLRQYEKINQERNYLIIKPTVDKMVSIGESSSISDEKNNVHWFVANSDTAYTFDVIMLDLGGEKYDIHNLDIYEKYELSDGTMRVPILDVETALRKYGKETHH